MPACKNFSPSISKDTPQVTRYKNDVGFTKQKQTSTQVHYLKHKPITRNNFISAYNIYGTNFIYFLLVTVINKSSKKIQYVSELVDAIVDI